MLGDVIMHQEVSKREKVSTPKLIMAILMAAIVLIVINSILVMLEWNSSVTDLMIIGFTSLMIFLFIKQNMISYKYCLIEDDFIVHEVLGTKEKRMLNLNIHQVLKFDHVQLMDQQYELVHSAGTKLKLYNSINNKNRHYMVYNDNNEVKCIILQPSDHMIELIQQRIEQ